MKAIANNATLTIAGDFDPDSAKAWVARYFGDIPRGPQAITRPTPPPVALARDTFLVLEDRVQLPRVYYAWHSDKLFSPDDAALGTPAERWGVATRSPRILLCGSGARRGGAVSGIGGHNAAMAVLETD